MEFVIIEIGSKEWEYMWEWLANHPINEGLEQPSVALNEGESWQYMGSYKQNDKVIHQMRHRLHPVTQRVEQINLNCSDEFTNDQIKKSFKI
jgi:hypothetical protein